MEPKDIEDTLEDLATQLSVSTAKLRAIYARGVDECLEQGYEGAPYTYGLARVQRFATALDTRNPRLTADTDFLPRTQTDFEPTHYVVSEDTLVSWGLIYDMMSAEGHMLEASFPVGSITQTVYDTDKNEITVLGNYDDVQWTCVLNLVSGENVLTTDND